MRPVILPRVTTFGSQASLEKYVAQARAARARQATRWAVAPHMHIELGTRRLGPGEPVHLADVVGALPPSWLSEMSSRERVTSASARQFCMALVAAGALLERDDISEDA